MGRLTNKEVENSIFSLDKKTEKQEPKQDNERSVVAYSELLSEVSEDDSKAYAKEVRLDTKTIYYVKQNKNGRLYNPNGIYSERQQQKQLRYGPNWNFREVSKKVFEYYTKFLETKNEAWLSHAERELV